MCTCTSCRDNLQNLRFVLQVSAYLSDYDSKFQPVAAAFAAMTANEAIQLNTAIETLEDTKDNQAVDEEAARSKQRAVGQLIAKQIIWRGMSLGCYAAGKLNVQDAGHMLQLMVRMLQSIIVVPCCPALCNP
jgi:hypothetical protein